MDDSGRFAIARIGRLRNIRLMAQSFDSGAPTGDALVGATQWVEGMLLGGFRMTLTVIAVACAGIAR